MNVLGVMLESSCLSVRLCDDASALVSAFPFMYKSCSFCQSAGRGLKSFSSSFVKCCLNNISRF